MTVSNIGINFANNQAIKSLASQIADLSRQVSTGSVADTYADLGSKAGTSLNLHAQYNALVNYVGTINGVALKTNNMDTSLSNITSQIQNVTSAMLKLSQGGVPNAGTLAQIQTNAQNALASIMASLNTSVGGEYVFAGNQTDKPPIADTTAAGTNVATIVGTYSSSATPAATVIANLNAMTETQLGYDPGLAAAGNNTFQAAENVTLNYTLKADGSTFQQVIKGLAEISSLQYDPNHPTDFWALYTDAQSRLTTGSTGVTTAQGQLGITRNQMATLSTQQQATQLTVSSSISTFEDADLAQVAAQLATLQTQQQATYKIISDFSQNSLVQYLS